MKSRPYKITLEKIETRSTVQHFDNAGNYTTEEVVQKVEYEIVKIQNLVTIELPKGVYRAGDRISEESAQILCDGSCYDVTITR